MEFNAFPKIPRMGKAFECVITEKIDGTNAQFTVKDGEIINIGSRKRWITPDDDNFGFARWVRDNEKELVKLGDGTYFGEWFGIGIQRGYGLSYRSLALFNPYLSIEEVDLGVQLRTVPNLYNGDFSYFEVGKKMSWLKVNGSKAVEGFMKPEGVMIYFPHIKQYVKHTFEHQEGKWKGEQ